MSTYHGTEGLVAVDIDSGVAFGDADDTTSFSTDFEGGIEEIYRLGSRLPQELKEGQIAISFTLERHFQAGNYSSAGTTFMGMVTTIPLDEFWVAYFPEGDASPKILISNCKFGGYSTSVDAAGMLVERATGKGLLIAVT